jgi:hypothetical protein
VIHRGGPYGGHYHAYIRDDLEDGNWDLELPDYFQSEPTEVEKEAQKKQEPAPEKEEIKTNNKKKNKKKAQKD